MTLVKDRSRQHWALDFYNEEPTPWLLPPKSKMNNVVFDPSFTEWHGRRWMDKFKKHDIYEAIADFIASLFNNPDRILLRWQEYEMATKHYASTAIAQSQIDPMGLRESDKQHLIRYQSALMSNTTGDNPTKVLAPEHHPAISEAIEQGEIKLVRHFYRGAFINGVQALSEWFNTEEEWLNSQTKRLHGETA